MLLTYRRVSRISVAQGLALVASIAILVGVVATMAVVVIGAACVVGLLRAIGAIRLTKPSARFPDHATIEGVVVHSSDIADRRI